MSTVHHIPKGYNAVTPYLVIKGAADAIAAKQRIIAKIKETFFGARKPMRDLKKSQLLTW